VLAHSHFLTLSIASGARWHFAERSLASGSLKIEIVLSSIWAHSSFLSPSNPKGSLLALATINLNGSLSFPATILLSTGPLSFLGALSVVGSLSLFGHSLLERLALQPRHSHVIEWLA
jgi:hypothetical protein